MILLMGSKQQNKLRNNDLELNFKEENSIRSKSIFPSQKNKNQRFFENNNEISFQQRAIPKLRKPKRMNQNRSVITSPQSESHKIVIPTLKTQTNGDLNASGQSKLDDDIDQHTYAEEDEDNYLLEEGAIGRDNTASEIFENTDLQLNHIDYSNLNEL